MRILIVWLINTVALLVLPYLMTSIRISGFWTALIAALVLGLVNALIRPILVVLTWFPEWWTVFMSAASGLR